MSSIPALSISTTSPAPRLYFAAETTKFCPVATGTRTAAGMGPPVKRRLQRKPWSGMLSAIESSVSFGAQRRDRLTQRDVRVPVAVVHVSHAARRVEHPSPLDHLPVALVCLPLAVRNALSVVLDVETHQPLAAD